MAQAMKIKVGNPIRKLILLKLADNANDQGECWPSYQHIADGCECGKTTVKDHINALIKHGLLSKENRLGMNNEKGNTSNLYYLHLNTKPIPPKGIAPMSTDDTPPMPPAGTRISHSFEPVMEPNTPTASKICAIEAKGVSIKLEDPIPNPGCFPAQPPATDIQTATVHSLASRYAFEGKIIRLTPQDFDSWQALFPHLDLVYELTRLDLEFRHDTPKSWFCTASQKLNYQNKRAVDGTTFKRVSGEHFAKKDYGTTVFPAWMEG